MTTCPLCGHENPDEATECASCGHVFAGESARASFFERLPRHTRRYLTVFYAIAALDGVAVGAGWGDADFVLSIAAGLAAAGWVITDASDRGRPFRTGAKLLVILFGGLASFFYLIASRHLRGLGWFLLNLVGYVATIAVAYAIMALVSTQFAPMLFAPDRPAIQPDVPVAVPEGGDTLPLPPLPAE